MRVEIVAVGTRMPDWVEIAVAEYQKRLRSDMPLSFVEVPLAKRAKGVMLEAARKLEGQAILSRLREGSYVVALEVKGKPLSTEALARQLNKLAETGRPLSLLVGGPDGLHESCRDRADALWSLSALTLPHPLVRVILAEQLYRANSFNKGHPYHRG